MKQYHVYKDSEGLLQVVETTGMETSQEVLDYLAFLIGIEPNEVDYYGCLADSPEDAMQRFKDVMVEFKSSPDDMRTLHATAAKLRAQLNYAREHQQ